jgi:hypothetical protein
MKHIGYALLHNGKPTGQMKTLCGALVSTVLDAGAKADDICPRCKEINDREGAANG